MTMNGFGAFVRSANPNYLEHTAERRGGEVNRIYGSWFAVLVEVTHRVIVQPPVRRRKVRSNMRDRPLRALMMDMPHTVPLVHWVG